MNASPNAFSRPEQQPTKRLASMLRPMVAARHATEFGWSLELSPMRAVDALRNVLDLPEDARKQIEVLVTGVKQQGWADKDGPLPARIVANRLGIPVRAAYGDDAVVFDAEAAIEFAGTVQTRSVTMVVVAGPIEERDAKSMSHAAAADGYSPLDVEFRAIAAIEVEHDRAVRMDARASETLSAIVAENFRHYLSAILNQPVERILAPAAWQIDRLFSENGCLTVRPIETDIFSTSVDVGVATQELPAPGPAKRSIVYDRPSGTWHDES